MYLTTDLETDETTITSRRSKLLNSRLGIKIEKEEDLEKPIEADKSSSSRQAKTNVFDLQPD